VAWRGPVKMPLDQVGPGFANGGQHLLRKGRPGGPVLQPGTQSYTGKIRKLAAEAHTRFCASTTNSHTLRAGRSLGQA